MCSTNPVSRSRSTAFDPGRPVNSHEVSARAHSVPLGCAPIRGIYEQCCHSVHSDRFLIGRDPDNQHVIRVAATKQPEHTPFSSGFQTPPTIKSPMRHGAACWFPRSDEPAR